MNKISLVIVFIIAALLLFAGCGNSVGDFTEKDFILYDENENEIMIKESHSLSTTPELYTSRGVKIGDDAVEAIEKYNLPIKNMFILENPVDSGYSIEYDTDIDNLCKKSEYCRKIDDFSEAVKDADCIALCLDKVLS